MASGNFDVLAAIGDLRRREERGRASRHAASTSQRGAPPRYAPPVLEGPLRIAIPVNRVDPGGGSRVVIEHANRLSALGHQVTVIGHGARPEWTPLHCDYRQVPYEVELMHGLGVCDVVVATYWDQLTEARLAGRARVVYVEQGDYHLYDEITESHLRDVAGQLGCADAIVAISDSAAEALHERYGVSPAAVVRNGVDRSLFKPGPRELGERPYMLVVGAQHNAFKRLEDAFAAWELLKAAGHDLDLVWVTPTVPFVAFGRVVLSPSQAELVRWYRNAAVFVSASEYESFSLPPLEAMACGTPVVVAANDGVLRYARDGENALVVPARSPLDLAEGVERVLVDEALRQRLVVAGLTTAERFDWDDSIRLLENTLRLHSGARLEDVASEWTLEVTPTDFMDADGFERLQATLRDAPECVVEVPLVCDAFHRHQLASWIVAARRPSGTGTLRLWTPIRRLDVGWSEGVELFRNGWARYALDWFIERFAEASSDEDRLCWVRWIVLAAIEARADEVAVHWLRQGIQLSPVNADLWYLAGLVQVLAGYPSAGSGIAKALAALGDAASHDEFLFGVAGLARAQLLPPPPPATSAGSAEPSRGGDGGTEQVRSAN